MPVSLNCVPLFCITDQVGMSLEVKQRPVPATSFGVDYSRSLYHWTSYRVCLKCLSNLLGWVTTQQGQKFVSVCIRKLLISKVLQTTCSPQSFRFVSGRTLKNFSNTFCMPVKSFATVLDHWKGAPVDQTCVWKHWFTHRTFWAYVVNCDLVNVKNTKGLKLGTCIINVLCQL
jgi:hypothetical protein